MKKTLLLIASLILSFTIFAQHNTYLLLGTYTSGKSEGIYVYKFNSNTGDVTYVSKVATTNPSYLTVSPDKKFVYAVNEEGKNKGGVTAFAFNKQTGTLQLLNKQSSGGDDPCYITTDKTGKWVVAGNYSGGNLSVFHTNADGSLQPASQTIQHTGSGINKSRQEKPHVHSTVFSPDGKYLFVSDLGTDKIMTYTFSNGKLAAAPVPATEVKAGNGPRHFVFHPNGKYAYLMEEMGGAISSYKYENGKLHFIERINALPVDYKGSLGSADIHISADGKFLYGSNRGESNTIVICKIDPANGKLTVVGHQDVMGKTPRNFNFDPSGNFLLVANQNSDNVVIFKRDKQTGLLKSTGKQIEAGNPVCVKWIVE